MARNNPTRNGLRIFRETAINYAKYGTPYPTPEQIAEYEAREQAQLTQSTEADGTTNEQE